MLALCRYNDYLCGRFFTLWSAKRGKLAMTLANTRAYAVYSARCRSVRNCQT